MTVMTANRSVLICSSYKKSLHTLPFPSLPALGSVTSHSSVQCFFSILVSTKLASLSLETPTSQSFTFPPTLERDRFHFGVPSRLFIAMRAVSSSSPRGGVLSMNDLDLSDSELCPQAVHRVFDVGECCETAEFFSCRHSLQGKAIPFDSSGFE